MSSFTSPLNVKVLDNGDKYELLEPFEYYIDDENGAIFCVEKGFITDFASIPRIFWNIFPPFGKYSKAAVLHDKLCIAFLAKQTFNDITKDSNKLPNELKDKLITRKEADKYFLEAMRAVKVGRFTRFCLYFGVRLYSIIKYGRKV